MFLGEFWDANLFNKRRAKSLFTPINLLKIHLPLPEQFRFYAYKARISHRSRKPPMAEFHVLFHV